MERMIDVGGMKKTAVLFILLFLGKQSFGQTSKKDFQAYAHIQDSLCVQAYEKHDDKKYEKLLKEFLSKYNKLPDSTKNEFTSKLLNIYYNYCCLFSLQNNKVQALNYFEKCVQLKYHNYDHVIEDSDLNNIRNEDRFKTLLAQVRSVGDYSYILERAEKYNFSDSREIPKFTYQSPDDPNLAALKKGFKLDSIAGTGNDLTQILNLLHWIHNLVPHDGSHGNPEIKNAMNMIAVCKKDKRGLNCRGLATVLNECYLSLGIKSRFITCLPKDSLGVDDDCHVINMVYSTSLKKWLWIDPTFDAYIMNENGEMLGIEEVRERILAKKPLLLNPDANWNHRSSQTKDHYLFYYMTKNLYRLECPLRSEYDTETPSSTKSITYVDLLPLSHWKQGPDRSESVSKYTGMKYIYYLTNNPAKFWAAPEN
jgi:hypothetical protein